MFSHKLTDTDIYAQLLYRIHANKAEKLDEAGVLEVVTESVQQQNKHLQHKDYISLICHN